MSREQDALTGVALTCFRLNGQFLAVSEELAEPSGLTAAWWQVLGAVLRTPLPVSGIAREMGVTRQSVQRIADLLVEKGMAEYLPNPSHRRAKLLGATADGLAAVRLIEPTHRDFADRLAEAVGLDELETTLQSLQRLSATLDDLAAASTHRQAR